MNNQRSNVNACPYFIVVDTSLISSADLPQWTTENSQYFASPAIGNLQNIDASRISENDLSQWLYDNQTYISYDDSNDYFQCVHFIADITLQKIVQKAPEVCQVTFGNLITIIENQGVVFENPSYVKYAALSFNDQKLVVNMIIGFNALGNSYSIPFLNSIIKKNSGVSLTTPIIFKSCLFPTQTTEKITMSVNVGGSVIKNYDFSQVPP